MPLHLVTKVEGLDASRSMYHILVEDESREEKKQSGVEKVNPFFQQSRESRADTAGEHIMDKVVGLVNKLQQICSSLGETALSANAVLWNKLPTIVVVGGQVRTHDYV